MSFWHCADDKDRDAAVDNLRLLRSEGAWLAWNDRTDDDGKTLRGAHKEVEERLLAGLNATNLLVLLGSGASFAARNASDKQAPGMGDLWNSVSTAVGEEIFENVVNLVAPGTKKQNDIEALLSLCKMTVELRDANPSGDEIDADSAVAPILKQFVKNAEKAILDRVDFVDGSTDLTAHKEFLRRLARRSAEKPRVKIFTTNYDRCIEEAAVARNLVLIDGFSHSAIQRFNRDHFHHDIVRRVATGARADYLDGVFHLYKVHGSMDWRRRKSDGVVIRSMEDDDGLEPVLIYPRSSKYQEAFSPPYLDMFSAWQSALREPDTTLVVSGFGFNDDHISEPIWAALESNLSLRLVLCNPNFVPEAMLASDDGKNADHAIAVTEEMSNRHLTRILKLVTEGDSRITVLNGRFNDLALAMPEIVGETDRQRLEARLERIRGGENAAG